MKKTQSNAVSPEPAANLLKTQYRFDDSSIRNLLRNSYEDSLGIVLEIDMGDPLEMTPIVFPRASEESSQAETPRLQGRPDLDVFWNLHLQKQIVVFEQEALTFLNWDEQYKW